jgi:hypothetical protein
LTESANAIAGVTSAAIVTVNPLERGSFGAAIETEDRPLAPREAGLIVNNRLVTHQWFETAGVPIIRGRAFTAQDDERAAAVVIVSKRMADRLWPGSDPINERIRATRPNAPWLTVVGVAGDVRDFGEWRETWYLPYAQQASTFGAATLHLMVRSPLQPDVLGSSVKAAVHAVDPHLPAPIPTPMASLWDRGLEQQQLAAAASGLFGVSGLLLAVIGTYGVLAYAVSARTREFGIRLALGADRSALVVDVLKRGTVLTGLGLSLGALAGFLAARGLASVATESHGVPLPAAIAALAALAASAIVASLVPALRATRVDPADVMRTE